MSGNTVNQMVGALRFFYLTVLNKPWRGHEMPYPKKNVRLPVIWFVAGSNAALAEFTCAKYEQTPPR